MTKSKTSTRLVDAAGALENALERASRGRSNEADRARFEKAAAELEDALTDAALVFRDPPDRRAILGSMDRFDEAQDKAGHRATKAGYIGTPKPEGPVRVEFTGQGRLTAELREATNDMIATARIYADRMNRAGR